MDIDLKKRLIAQVLDAASISRTKAESLVDTMAAMIRAGGAPSKEMSEQPARFAIDGAIALGRIGNAMPPEDHWLREFWEIGRQLAKLGETCAWDNVTPMAAADMAVHVADGAGVPLNANPPYPANSGDKFPRHAAAPAQPPMDAGLIAIYDLFGIGALARSIGTLTTCVRNTIHFADLLHAVEREFFMVPGEPDPDSDHGEDPQEECLLNCWGSTQAQYLEQFRAALTRIAAPAQPVPEPVALEAACRELIAYVDANPPMADSLWCVQKIRALLTALPAGAPDLRSATERKPIAWMRFWAAQRWDGRGDIDYDEGYEVCKEGDKGVDGSPAFPVFDIPQATPPAATAAPELTDAKCTWSLDDYNDGYTWQSACGEAWSFIDGGPEENRVRHCHGCGKPVAIAHQSADAGKEAT